MPMPHRTQMQLIKRRLVGKEGVARSRELRAILTELPNYKNGPYADVRRWVNEELEATRRRSSVVHRDSVAVRREGAAQVALVGAPNAGKSSLLQALSNVQIKTGDYAFTTTRPVPALTRIHGVLVQLVEIPGLIEGAAHDRGGGRALLSVLRTADAMVLCHPATAAAASLSRLQQELETAGIVLPTLVARTRADEAVTPGPGLAVSVLDDASVDRLREAIWDLTGLVVVRLRHDGSETPVAFSPPVTVRDVAESVHHELGARCAGGRVWGPSARFEGQRVGRDHRVSDGDAIEILT